MVNVVREQIIQQMGEGAVSTLRDLRNRYDVTNPEHARRRRKPAISHKSADKERTPHDRLKQIAFARDLMQNNSPMVSMVDQLRLNSYGNPKVIFNTEDKDWNEAAAEYFNAVFSKNCDGRDDTHLAYLNENIFESVIRDGDILQFFDATGVMVENKFFFWEADQIASIDETDFKNNKDEIKRRLGVGDDEDIVQCDGVILHARIGKPLGYVVQAGYGDVSIPWEKASVIPVGPSKLHKTKRRINAKRGNSHLLTCSPEIKDWYEISQAILGRMKSQANLAMTVKRNGSGSLAAVRSTGNTITGDDEAVTGSEQGAKITVESPVVENERVNYESFEKLTQGAIEYIEPDEEIESFQMSGDTPDYDKLKDITWMSAGASLGLPRVYALQRAEASFSAMRGEQNMAGVTFDWWQKFIERSVMDFEVNMSISYAISKGILPPNDEWRGKFTFSGWAKIRPIDPLKDVLAKKQAHKAGYISYENILGPDWEKKLKKNLNQQEWIFTEGLFVDVLEPPQSKASTN